MSDHTRQARGGWSKLIEQFRAVSDVVKEWRIRDFELFFEVETVLHLHSVLIPGDCTLLPHESWALVSGYFIPGINDQAEKRVKCLALRDALRYVKTASAWHLWLGWYQEHPESIRLYKFSHSADGNQCFQERRFDTPLGQERLSAYNQLLEPHNSKGSKEIKPIPYAPAGKYSFKVQKIACEVEITAQFASFANAEQPHLDIPNRLQRVPIEINLDELYAAAQELEELEAMCGISEPRRWVEWLNNMRLTVPAVDAESLQRSFTIDGLFHLVGMLGTGKSTLIRFLTYYLTQKRRLQITVVMNTVVEAIRFAQWLKLLGVPAAPALGRSNRADHARKYGLANAEELDPARMFQLDTPASPALDWLVAICALSGAQNTAIPVGMEPCYNLLDDNGTRYRCPLLPTCPVHKSERDLVESRVWVVNPWSFLHSSAPDGVGDERMRLLDAIYRVSDLVIIDEVDRVQVQWDNSFAPTRQLAGSINSLLDIVHRGLGEATFAELGRSRAASAQFNRLTNLSNKASILSNHVFRLLSKTPQLATWIKSRQLTNANLFWRLTEDLIRLLPPTLDDAQRIEIRQTLGNTFSSYWRRPLQNEQSVLTTWVNRLVGADVPEKALRRELAEWLATQIGWKLPLREKRLLVLNKLDFALTLAAMLKYTSDLSYLLVWAETELGRIDTGDFDLPDAIVDRVPIPPLGDILGARHMGYKNSRSLGVFNMLRYRGIGRWLLLNFPELDVDQTGESGPHLLLTSATSWLPGAAQFHLDWSPNAVLLAPTNALTGRINIFWRPIRPRTNLLKVSGAGKHRERNLRLMVQKLAKAGRNTLSALDAELQYWRERGERRAILLVVASYDQAEWVLNELNKLPEWQARVKRLIPDEYESQDEDVIRAREVERLKKTSAEILIAPLMAIQRGFNILDEDDAALLGSVYFLVRPYPPPDDLGSSILGMNAWTMQQLQGGRRLSDRFAEYGIEALKVFRKRAYREWNRRLHSNRAGVDALDQDLYDEFLRDQFVVIWQTTGRLLRGGRDARVYFVDGAFAPGEGHRNMLPDWYTMLADLLNTSNMQDQQLARWLYGHAWEAFQTAFENKEIR